MFEFKLPEIGEGVVEGEIVQWLVKAGDVVKNDDPVVEVMTDKATVEVLISTAGVVSELKVDEGDIVAIGAPLLSLDDGVGTISGQAGSQSRSSSDKITAPELTPIAQLTAIPPSVASLTGQAIVEAASSLARTNTVQLVPPKASSAAAGSDVRPARGSAAPDKVLASPAARAAARELGVDVESVAGTGPSGRVTPDDVRVAAPGLRRGGGDSGPALALSPLTKSGGEEREKMRGLRRKISEAMVASTTTIPHFTYVDEVDMGAVVELRDSLKGEAAAQGVKLSYLSFVALAARRAMQDYPIVNAWHEDESGEVVHHPEMHLGISVDTPRGLYVGVVHDAGSMGLFDLAAAIAGVADRVREGKASSAELSGSTFTITSVGNIGGLFATPVINKPEVAILGMNRIVERPVVRKGQVVVRPMAYLSPSFDHRVVDGAVGARFTSRLKALLENPARIWLPEG